MYMNFLKNLVKLFKIINRVERISFIEDDVHIEFKGSVSLNLENYAINQIHKKIIPFYEENYDNLNYNVIEENLENLHCKQLITALNNIVSLECVKNGILINAENKDIKLNLRGEVV